jgi:uncharacterized membrane protein
MSEETAPSLPDAPEGQKKSAPEISLDSEKKPANQNVVLFRSEETNGLLPPPSMLEGYERVLPGSADRLLKMAEAEQAHRQSLEAQDLTHSHAIERSQVETDAKLQSRGLNFAFGLALVTILSGGVLIGLGSDGAGFALILGTVGTIAGAFFISRRFRDKPAIEPKMTDDTPA